MIATCQAAEAGPHVMNQSIRSMPQFCFIFNKLYGFHFTIYQGVSSIEEEEEQASYVRLASAPACCLICGAD